MKLNIIEFFILHWIRNNLYFNYIITISSYLICTQSKLTCTICDWFKKYAALNLSSRTFLICHVKIDKFWSHFIQLFPRCQTVTHLNLLALVVNASPTPGAVMDNPTVETDLMNWTAVCIICRCNIILKKMPTGLNDHLSVRDSTLTSSLKEFY